ncbi:MAG: ParB N-terminal domain-containing protein [Bacteroidetes bacterium]|nr:ParB N-terminal domain-containing protein [Bacteroidota bacterium]
MIFFAQELKIDKDLITGFKILNCNDLKGHELVVQDRFKALTSYLQSLKPYIILPSILVCDKTNTIIDGHHRYSALIELGIQEIPVTYINYNHNSIVPHIDDSISKQRIIEASMSGKLLEPKSSFHHIKNLDGKYLPIILLSSLFSINNFD